MKLISLLISFCLILEQSAFAQSLDLSAHFANFGRPIPQTDKFRPLHLRYISYDNQANDFKLLLDKGDYFKSQVAGHKSQVKEEDVLKETTQELMRYFFIGLSLPNDKFWVNLRPDSPDNILDLDLERTDIGRIFLEADVQLKKDTARFTSPQTPEGKDYWDKLYKRAEELFGTENITIPTLTRPWIVPNEIIIRESPEGAYIYKATLKVLLEEDYLKNSNQKPEYINQEYSFNDSRLKQLNEYSTQLIRETIIPKFIYQVNTSKRYAPLRQVYYSLILAQWFKARFGKPVGQLASKPVNPLTGSPANPYLKLIDSRDLTNLTSKEPYDKQTYFRQYQKSFTDGEYNLSEPVYTSPGQSIRRYMSGGLQMDASSAIEAGRISGRGRDKNYFNNPYIINMGEGTKKEFPERTDKIAASPVKLEGKTLLTVTSDIHLIAGVHTYMFKLTNMLASRHKNLTQIILYNDTLNLKLRDEEKVIGTSKIIFIPFREDNLEKKIQDIKAKYHIDIVFTHVPLSPEGLMASHFSAKHSIPFGIYVHWGDSFSGAWKRLPGLKDDEGMERNKKNLQESLTVNPNTFILTVSEAGQKEIQEVAGKSSKVIGPMVATDIFKPASVSEQEKEALRRNLGIKNDDTVLLFPSSFQYRKGPDELVAAILHYRNSQYLNWFIKLISSTKISSRILKNYGIKNLKIVFVGEIFDTQLFEETQRKIKEYGLEDTFIFQGKVSQEKLRVLYAVSDIVILPSKEEGFGLVVAEASLMGVPTIAYDIPGVNEVIVHNETGLLVPWDNNPAIRIRRLAKAVGSLMNNPERMKTMGAQGQKHSLEKFNPEALILKHEEAYTVAMGVGSLAMLDKRPSTSSAVFTYILEPFNIWKQRFLTLDPQEKLRAEEIRRRYIWEYAYKQLGSEDIFGRLPELKKFKQMEKEAGRAFLLNILRAQEQQEAVPFTWRDLFTWQDDEAPVIFYNEIRDLLPGYNFVSIITLVDNGPSKADATEFFFINGVYVGYGVTLNDSEFNLEMQFQIFRETTHSGLGRGKVKGLSQEIFKSRLNFWKQVTPDKKKVLVRTNQYRNVENPTFYLRLEFKPVNNPKTDGSADYTGGLVLDLDSIPQEKVDPSGKKEIVSSVLNEKGGIDLAALPIATQQIKSLQSLSSSPLSINPNLNLDKEWAQIQAIFNAGIRPSVQRLVEFSAAAAGSPIESRRLDDVIGLIADTLRQEEQAQNLTPTDPVLRGLLGALESGR